MRKSRLRITGIDRAIMMLWRDARRRSMQYCPNMKLPKGAVCVKCGKPAEQMDHIKAIGARPRTEEEIPPKLKRMLRGKTQPMCRDCNRLKANLERKRRKK